MSPSGAKHQASAPFPAVRKINSTLTQKNLENMENWHLKKTNENLENNPKAWTERSGRIWAHSCLPETIIFQFGQLNYIGGKRIKSLQLLKVSHCRFFASKGNKFSLNWCRGGGGGNLKREVHSMVFGWYSWSTRSDSAGGEINWNPI